MSSKIYGALHKLLSISDDKNTYETLPNALRIEQTDIMSSNETVRVENDVSKLYYLQFISIGISTFLNEHFQLV